ncbi:MAG: VanZ family protein [Rhizobiales bacterium]|jgi:hypothetical protein|nr:VanZ family protein [Hyphomicrobiales bacterium]
MDQRILRILAWASIVAIFVVTDGPIAFRPSLGLGANAERLLAFTVVGVLFALAYPHRWPMILAFLIGAAALFEVLQLLVLGRHGYFRDFVFKATGAVVGVAGVWALGFCRRPGGGA